MLYDYDFKKFCSKCGLYDSDFGCTSPSGEELWQCPIYIHYHPDEVKKFNEVFFNEHSELITVRNEK